MSVGGDKVLSRPHSNPWEVDWKLRDSRRSENWPSIELKLIQTWGKVYRSLKDWLPENQL